MELVIFILMVLILMAVCQMMAITVFWHRFSAGLRGQEPPNARLVVQMLGPDAIANARVLARYTRLDTAEIDELVAEQQWRGPLPLPLSWRRAQMLATELRALGGEVDVVPR